jgi:hypothetical protein
MTEDELNGTKWGQNDLRAVDGFNLRNIGIVARASVVKKYSF